MQSDYAVSHGGRLLTNKEMKKYLEMCPDIPFRGLDAWVAT